MKYILRILICLLCVILLVVNFYPPLGKKPSKSMQNSYQALPYYQDGKFINLEETSIMSEEESSFDKTNTTPESHLPVNKLENIPNSLKEDFNIIWFGHSSSMVQIEGKNILIDPVWSDFTSPVQFIGPKRFSDYAINSNNLPSIDTVLISHDHYDHLDYQTIKSLDHKIKHYYVPLGVDAHLLSWGIDESKITCLGWYDEIQNDDITIISTPARHYSGRVPWNNNTTLWSGYIIKSKNYQVYYSGDSGYGSHFKDIYKRYGAMDVSLIECGQYDEAWHSIHMLPNETIQAAKDTHTQYLIPVHNSSYSLSNHPWDHPLNTLSKLSKSEDVTLITPMIGDIVNYKEIEKYQNNWWKKD